MRSRIKIKRQEVRKFYTKQYVKLNILESYVEADKKIVTDVAIINTIENPKTATSELFQAKGNTFVYDTGAEEIVIKMRENTSIRIRKIMKREAEAGYNEATYKVSDTMKKNNWELR